MSAAAWSAATGFDSRSGRRRLRSRWSPARPPRRSIARRRRLPGEHAAGGRAGAAARMVPQETILFDRARLRRTHRVDLAGDAQPSLGRGRGASAARDGRGRPRRPLRDRWRVRRDGRLVLPTAAARRRVRGDRRRAAAGCGGARASPPFVYVAPPRRGVLDCARECAAAEASRAGATLIERPAGRALSWPPRRLRCARAFALFWPASARAAAGLPPRCRGSGNV